MALKIANINLLIPLTISKNKLSLFFNSFYNTFFVVCLYLALTNKSEA